MDGDNKKAMRQRMAFCLGGTRYDLHGLSRMISRQRLLYLDV